MTLAQLAAPPADTVVMAAPLERVGEAGRNDAASHRPISNPLRTLEVSFESVLKGLAKAPASAAGGPVLPVGQPCPPGRTSPEAGSVAVRDRAASSAADEAPRSEIDPLALALAAPPSLVPAAEPPQQAVNAVAAGSVEPAWESVLVAEVVRRLAWGGDRRRGVARLDLGGELEGTRITVEGEGREVSVDIELGAGDELGDLQERLLARFAARGLRVRAFDVR